MVDDAFVGIESLCLGVGDQVSEQITDSLGGLFGPATFSDFPFLALSVSTDSTGVLSEWNDLFVFENVVHVLNGSLKHHTLHGFGDFVSVLVMCSQISNFAFCG